MEHILCPPFEESKQTQSPSHSTIKTQPRQGWEEAAKRAHENGDDQLLIPDEFDDETFEDWTW